MNELANTERQSPVLLESLAAQARMFAQNAAMNLLQIGRVLTEARPLIPHGEFDGWCRENAKMSRRTAEQYMQAYAEFGLNPRIAELGTSKVVRLLPMTEEEREKLLSENDVEGMTTRQMEAAIRAQREALRKEAMEEAREAIEAAEQRAREAENRPPEELVNRLRERDRTIQDQQAEIERLGEVGKDAVSERVRLMHENAMLRRDIRERDEDIQSIQADLDRAQEDLLNLQSSVARGEAEKPCEALTAETFAMAVNSFVGTCCRMPQMGRTFAGMDAKELEAYDQALRTLETWAEGARLAMRAVAWEEAIVIG